MIADELVLLFLLAALGSAPAALLSDRFCLAARVAAAPVLGFGIGIDVFTSLLYFFPASETFWLLPVLGGASLICCILLRRRRPKGGRDVMRLGAEILIVCIAIAGPLDYTFFDNHSEGPVSYQVPDAFVYVSEMNGAQLQSLQTADAEHPKTDLMLAYWDSFVRSNTRLDAAPLEANVDALIGATAVDTQSALLVLILVLGGLGAYSACLYLYGRRTWAAVVSGVLFGGPFFWQLFFDGSQAAICCLVLLPMLVVIGIDAFRKPRPAMLVLLAMLLGACFAVYPILVPPILVASAIALLLMGIAVIRRRGWGEARRLLGRSVLVLLAVGFMAIVSDIVGFYRGVESLLSVSTSVGGQPHYNSLVPATISTWLLQLREFYNLSLSAHPPLSNLLLALALPVVLVITMTVGALRRPILLVVFGVIVSFAIVAGIAGARPETSFPNGCSYCEDRYLLPTAPLAIVLIGVGVAVLFASRGHLRFLSVGVVLVFLAVVGIAATNEQRRFSAGSYFLPSALRSLLGHVPAGSGAIEIEGFNEAAPTPIAEDNLVYNLVEETERGRASILMDAPDNNTGIYFGAIPSILPLSGGVFDPNYEYVLTRIAGVDTNRKLIAKAGSLGLYRRSGLDVTLDGGMSVTYPSSASGETPVPNLWITEPMRFVVTGAKPTSRVYLRLSFAEQSIPLTVSVSGGVPSNIVIRGESVDVCVPTSLTTVPTVRTVDFSVSPIAGAHLLAMTATTHDCLHDR